MSIEKYVSDIKVANCDVATVYAKLSDFNILSQLFSPENLERAKTQIPDAKKLDKMKIEDFKADSDSCSFKVASAGRVGMRIIEREPTKTIKIGGDGTVPFEFTIWIQLLPSSAYQSKLRLTVHADLNMMMKMMIGKKLKKGVNDVAEGLSKIPFTAL